MFLEAFLICWLTGAIQTMMTMTKQNEKEEQNGEK